MDFSALKNNLRFRSGRTKRDPKYLSKRFPTQEAPPKNQRQQQQQYHKSHSDGVSGEEKEAKPTEIQLSKPKRRRKGATEAEGQGVGEGAANGEAKTEVKAEGVSSNHSPATPAGEGQLTQVNSEPSGPSDNPSSIDNQITQPDPRAQEESPNSHRSTEPNTKMSEPDIQPDSHSSGEDFDLRPSRAAPRPHPASLETLSELLFSDGYLSTLTSNPALLARFTSFLDRYRPGTPALVKRYIETQKVIKALEYANAVAASLGGESAKDAAELSPAFREDAQNAFSTLLRDALPAWVTYSLVKTATACLTAEITNASTPLTRDLVGGLSEVFCITDPTQADNPIVYSSVEFYRLTGYDKESVIGHNCRFLQGQRTLGASVTRLREAITGGKEICEVLLNYRRNGAPFINLLMLAPLHDDKGRVRYYLGAQVDASRLVEEGRGLDGFERFLARRGMDVERGRGSSKDLKKLALSKLRDLSLTFDLEESAVVQSNSRSNSRTRDDESAGGSARGSRTARRVLHGEDDESSEDDKSDEDEKRDPTWRLSQDSLASGSLPGIYQQYLLIRPYPSLRIVFASRAMRKLGRLQQRPFLAHVAAPKSTIVGLKESFESNVPVTAKIAMMREGGKRDGTVTGRWGKKNEEDPATRGRTCWISATPLLDGNNKVGVWMVVFADKASIASNVGYVSDLNQAPKTEAHEADALIEQRDDSKEQESRPIKPQRVGSFDQAPFNATPVGGKDLTNGEPPEISIHQNDKPSSDKNGDEARHMADSGYEEAFTNHQDGQPQHEGTSRSAKPSPEHDSENEVFSDAEADNEPPPAESLNGLASPRDEPKSVPDEDLSTPTRATFQVDEDVTPTRPQHHDGQATRSSMLGMDYLSARSPRHARPQMGVKSPNESDLPCRSPYSVD